MMVGGLFALACLMGVMALGPYADYTAARGRVEDLTGTQQELVQAVVELESERARLEDPQALEEEARRQLGMTRPGEIPYIVVNPPTPEPVTAAAAGAGAEPDHSPSLVDRVVELVSGWMG